MEVDASMHDHAQGGTTVLQDPKGYIASSTALPPTVARYTIARAEMHGYAPSARLAVRRACVAGFERFCSDSFIIFHSFVVHFRESTLERFNEGFIRGFSFIAFWIEFARLKIVLL